LSDGSFGRLAVGVLDERKPARATRFTIERPNDLRRLTDLRKVQSQVFFGGLVWKISYE
jgi:hypothetical protein